MLRKRGGLSRTELRLAPIDLIMKNSASDAVAQFRGFHRKYRPPGTKSKVRGAIGAPALTQARYSGTHHVIRGAAA
jgi:hypothetical protein